MKLVADILAPILVHIYKSCLAASVFPIKMQIAKVVMLHKKGDRNELGNYIPVSVLPIFSNELEKVIHIRISKFVENCELFTECEFCFRKNKPVELALLQRKEYILTQFKRKFITVGLFVSYTKEFDFVNYELLIKKLSHYGMRGSTLELIKSYLCYRQQIVQIDTSKLKIMNVPCGVPQGSILGLALFILYINDAVRINSSAKFIIYLDDTAIFLSGNNIHNLINICNGTVQKLAVCSLFNGMKIIQSKKDNYFYTKEQRNPSTCRYSFKRP